MEPIQEHQLGRNNQSNVVVKLTSIISQAKFDRVFHGQFVIGCDCKIRIIL